MRPLSTWLALLPLCVAATAFAADKGAPAVDVRYNLKLSPSEQAEFLAEMRNMLASVQHILLGIGTSDRALIAEYARRSGNRMARATPATVRAKTPPAFQALGGPTHLMFEELAIRAESDDMDMLARDTGQLMHQCMACHAAFRVR
jgi:cytochrome c556